MAILQEVCVHGVGLIIQTYDASQRLQWPWGSAGLILDVSLLSGRYCTLAFAIGTTMVDVKRQLAHELDLDKQQCMDHSKLVSESGVIIASLSELQVGRVHKVTLVLSNSEAEHHG